MKRKSIKEIMTGYFFMNPTSKRRGREIERKLKLPLPSVIRYCKELEQEGILARVKTGNVAFYVASRSETYFLGKKFYNIKQVYESELIEYLKRELGNPVVILFGSYAKGEDLEDSDIDLYVETVSKENIRVDTFERILDRKIQVFRHKNLKEIKNKHLANNILNGTVLNGFIEVFK